MMKILGHRESDSCPKCGEKETAGYALAYRDNAAMRVFHESVEMLGDWMVLEVQQAINQVLI